MGPSTGTGSDLRSDADLIVAARSRDAGAFGVLYERHAGAALVVARQYSSGTAEAEDAVADAFAAVWSALQGGSGPTDAFRAYLFTVVRRVAAVHRTKGRRAEPTDDVAVLEAGSMAEPTAEEPALASFERSIVARAFASLPERWQAVLWHSEVEGKTPAEVGPLLGLLADVETDDTDAFALGLLERRHVAVAPGSTFGAQAAGRVRVSLASARPVLLEALARLSDEVVAARVHPRIASATSRS